MRTEIFDIPARRCKRCGGILTSEQRLRDGDGSFCLKRMKEEEADAQMRKIQISFFDREGETK